MTAILGIKSLVYDVPEAGALLGLSRNSAYAAAKNGSLPTIKIGRLIRVPKAALQKMLDDVGKADSSNKSSTTR